MTAEAMDDPWVISLMGASHLAMAGDNLRVEQLDVREHRASKYRVTLGAGQSYFLKIGPADAIRRELAGYRILAAAGVARHMPQIWRALVADRVGGIVYEDLTALGVRTLDRHWLAGAQPDLAVCLSTVLTRVLICQRHHNWAPFEAPIDIGGLESDLPLAERLFWQELPKTCLPCASLLRAPRTVIHGDLHPHNVLVATDSRLFLVDYDLTEEDGWLLSDYARLELYLHLHFEQEAQWQQEVPSHYPVRFPVMGGAGSGPASAIAATRSALFSLTAATPEAVSHIVNSYNRTLLYELIRVVLRPTFPGYARQRARALALKISGGRS